MQMPPHFSSAFPRSDIFPRVCVLKDDPEPVAVVKMRFRHEYGVLPHGRGSFVCGGNAQPTRDPLFIDDAQHRTPAAHPLGTRKDGEQLPVLFPLRKRPVELSFIS